MELVEPSTEVISAPLPMESMNAVTLGSNLLPPGRTASKPSANSTPLEIGSTSAPSHYTYTQPLPMVTPAKRSLLATVTTRLGNLRHSRPSLSSNQSDSIYSPSFPIYCAGVRGSGLQQQNDNVQHNAAAPTLTSRSRRPALPLYRQGPVFPTRFQNNGPYNYSPENTSNTTFGSVHNTSLFLPPASEDSPMSSALDIVPSMAQGSFSNYYISRPLAPAFDWENHIPSQMSLNSSFSGYDISNADNLFPRQNPFQFHQPQNQQSGYLSYESAGYQQSLELISPPQIAGASLSAQLEQCDSFNEFLQGTPLDPSIAPLKHLTDILGNFKDGHGTYLPLMAEEERGKLVKCLLDDELVERNPFQAAMGLSLLSKLGVEWEM
ncbi:hypothetical protein GALMADRAFT_825219 [Galerina marginata CBS 339.88]|uniref:Uncharacterized protein n=1 Tax=Galerina marginata (strain CBS 339.88) TaxID=685588 RepID=A0A067TRF2_GALM3|nr:hypothetical protein GALMADRAFT_825219 [Galerina marginata CBS 339.88]